MVDSPSLLIAIGLLNVIIHAKNDCLNFMAVYYHSTNALKVWKKSTPTTVTRMERHSCIMLVIGDAIDSVYIWRQTDRHTRGTLPGVCTTPSSAVAVPRVQLAELESVMRVSEVRTQR